jgi:hypothetical protein
LPGCERGFDGRFDFVEALAGGGLVFFGDGAEALLSRF